MSAEQTTDRPHTIIAIGFLGLFVCYVDVPMEEAKRRYAARDEWPVEDADINVVTFSDTFTAYSVWNDEQ